MRGHYSRRLQNGWQNDDDDDDGNDGDVLQPILPLRLSPLTSLTLNHNQGITHPSRVHALLPPMRSPVVASIITMRATDGMVQPGEPRTGRERSGENRREVTIGEKGLALIFHSADILPDIIES